MGPPMGGQPAHSQGLQGGRLTPTHFGGGGGAKHGLVAKQCRQLKEPTVLQKNGGRAWWSSFRPFGLPIFRWWCWRSSWGIRQKQLCGYGEAASGPLLRVPDVKRGLPGAAWSAGGGAWKLKFHLGVGQAANGRSDT